MNKHAETAPCGGNPQGADGKADTLPFEKRTGRVREPMPNIETLKTILRLYGCSEQLIAVIADGFAPREFQLGMTRFWKIRDTFFMLAANAISRLNGRIPFKEIGLNAIMTNIAEIIPPNGFLFPETLSVMWECRYSRAGYFMWPSSYPSCATPELWASCRLFILNSIWVLHPALLAIDFSMGLGNFSNEDYARIQKLVADAIQSRPALPGVDYDPTEEVQRLLDVLHDGEKSRQELQEKLGVGRTVLLKRFLTPARESGLVVTTEQGSSPNQRYRLVSSTDAAGWKQAQMGSETGSKKPVSSGIVLPQKQAEPLKTDDSVPVAVSLFSGGHAPVRLARYVRWSEAERALILFGRVERFLRSSFASEEWKKLGIVNKLNANDLSSFENCLLDHKYWGTNGGVVIRKEFIDNNNNHWELAVGESNLLNLFAQKASLNLAACSETERSEMEKLAGIIPPAVLHLMYFYAQRFGISRGLDKPYHGDIRAMQTEAVDLFNLYHPGMSKIVFHGKYQAPQLQVARLDVAGRTLLLPATFYASAQDPMLYCMMPEVQDTPVLYNSDLIAANPGAEVILTDEIGIPLVNDSDGDYIFSSWFGGMEVIDKLDLDLLEGHPVRWLCFDNGEGAMEMYEKAVKVGNMIFQHHGRTIAFQVFDRATWTRNVFGMETGVCESTRSLSFDELMAEAAKYGVRGCGSAEFVALQDLSMDDLLKLKPKDFTLYPLLKEGFYCLIYGGSGVAKTWFALHLAICLSQGQAPFDGWEFRGSTPLNVMYIAGEMKEEEYGDRLRKLLAEQESNHRFRFIRKDLDLMLEKDQKWVMTHVEARKSQVVVLDNLSTLATNGHTEGQFEKILGFIRKLQADGIIVLLVHHENREGGFKGSGKIELVADQSLHLYSAGNGDKIELLVRAEKIRMTSRAEQTAFRTEFDPKDPVEVWPVFDLTEEQRRRLNIDDPLGEVERNIVKQRKNHGLAWKYLDDDQRAIAILDDMLSDCPDDVIAANFAIREIAITDFKQQHGLSEDAIMRILPMAKFSAKNIKEKYSSDILANEIWKLLKDNKE